MIKISAAIFDMDGTLTDSMQVWKTIGSEFLKSCGKEPREDVDRRFCSMSVYDAVRFMKEEYGIEGSHDEVTDAINKTVEQRYLRDVPLKDGVFEFLSELYYNDKTIITEFMANNMTDLRQKLAFEDFQSFKSLVSCLVFIHSRDSIEVFDKSTLQKYLA